MDLSIFENARAGNTPKPQTPPAPAEGGVDLSFFERARATDGAEPPARGAAPTPAPAPRGLAAAADRFAPSTVGNVAAAVDMAWGLLPQVAGVIVEAGSRLAYRNEPKKIRDSAAAMDKQKFVETFDRPVGKLMKMFGYGDVYTESDIERVMQAVGKAVEKGGDKIETSTGGSVSKEDVLATVDAVTAGLGMAGAKFTLGKYEKKMAPTAQFEARPPAPILDRLNALEARLGRKISSPADLRKAEAELEADAFRDQVEGIPTALRTGEGAKSVRDPRRRPVGDSGVMGVQAPDAPRIDPALAAGEGGRSVADPKRPAGYSGLEGVKPAQRKQMLYGLAAGGAAAAFAASYGEFDNETAAGLAAAGALIALPGREPLKLEAIQALPDATPLGAILDRSPYTLSTLEMLPKGRFEFTKTSIEELLKRQEVTKAEREVITPVLAAVPGETITAKQLMLAIKEATGDFELKRAETDDFAEYGIAALGRRDRFSGAFDDAVDPATFDRATAELDSTGRMWEVLDENGDQINAFMADSEVNSPEAAIARARRENDSLIEGPASATTTIYQSPIELGNANHFSDPNYFAHTRSFVEGGVRHVVELQSDLAQKAGKTLTPEEIARLEAEAKAADADLWAHRATRPLNDLNPVLSNNFRRGLSERELRIAELDTKLRAAKLANAADPVRPMLKDWHKRLIREEISRAAGEGGAPTIRFATADTVAKVEGWPEQSSFQFKDGTFIESKSRFSPEHQGIYDRYSRDVTKFLKSLGGKEVTDDKGVTWIEVPLEPKKGQSPLTRTQMFGIGAVAAGAGALSLLSEEEQGSAAAPLAAMALFAQSRSPAVRSAARRTVETAESVLGNLSTSIRNISEAMLRPVRKHELDVLKNTYERLKATTPFVERLKSLPREKREAISAALFSGKPGEVIPLVKALDPNLLPDLVAVRKVLADVGAGLVEVGKLKGLRPEYFPRVVADYEGLLKYLGSEGGASSLEKRLYAAERKALSKTGDAITPLDRSAIISDWLSQQMRGPGRSGFLKNRSVEQVTREMLPFYAPADEALIIYTRAATAEIERAKFFGKHLIRDEETNKVNVKASIHNVVEEKLRNKEISIEKLEELKDLLWARFGPGEQGMSGFVEDAKNLGYAALLAQPTAALVQLGDVATVVYAHGMIPTIKAVGQTLTGRGRMTTADFGLIDNISAETASTSGTARFVNKVFKWSGFNLVDRFGKSTAINASLDKYSKLARSERGVAKIQQKYGEYFGDDLGTLMSDLRAGRQSPLVDELIFSELSDLQPVSRAEMPRKYLEMQNGRILYMLKSFMLKQADIVRRDVYNEFKRGNHLAATNKALRFSLALGIGGASTEFLRNWLLGRDDELEWTDVPANVFKTFMLSEFVLDQPGWEKKLEAAGKSVLPPFGLTADIAGTGELALDWLRGEAEIEDGNAKAVRYIPIVGTALYHDALPFQQELGLEFGGAERSNRLREQRERRKERQELLGE